MVLWGIAFENHYIITPHAQNGSFVSLVANGILLSLNLLNNRLWFNKYSNQSEFACCMKFYMHIMLVHKIVIYQIYIWSCWEVSPNKTAHVFALSQNSTEFPTIFVAVGLRGRFEHWFWKNGLAIRHQNIRPNVLNDRVGREYFNNDVVENRHLSPDAAGGLFSRWGPGDAPPATITIDCNRQPGTIQIFTNCKWHMPNLMDDRVELRFTKSGLQGGKRTKPLLRGWKPNAYKGDKSINQAGSEFKTFWDDSSWLSFTRLLRV